MHRALCLPLYVASLAQAVIGAAQAPVLTLPSVKTSLNLEGQVVAITAWGTVAAASPGTYKLSVTIDLGDLQENLAPVLRARLNRSDRCGERLSLDRATLVPAGVSGLLTAYFHYERFACAKAFGKEIVKRLVGGNGVVDVNLTPSVADNRVLLAAQVGRMDADGSLGELLRSGSLGDSIRERVANSIESAIQKSADLGSMLPASIAGTASLQSVQFADGGSARLWVAVTGEVRLSPDQFRALTQMVAR